MHRTWLTGCTLIAASAAAIQPQTAATTEAQSLARASGIGTMLYAYDRAAWVATDALPKAAREGLGAGRSGGWVVEPAGSRTLLVTFYTGRPAAARAIFAATVRDGKVTERRSVNVPLTPHQTALATARDVAAGEASRRGYAPCTAAPFNAVVLPGPTPEAPVAVYLLSAQTEAGTYPMGGHFRIVVNGAGQVLSTRPFSRTCLNMTVPRLPAGAKPTGLFVNHLLDPVPTELHVFTSYSAHLPLFVGTPGGRVWSVAGSQITLSTMKPPAPPAPSHRAS